MSFYENFYKKILQNFLDKIVIQKLVSSLMNFQDGMVLLFFSPKGGAQKENCYKK